MSFKGDLSTIGLAEVFQMISMSQKEGTLVVQDVDSRKSIYFGATGVRLVSTGKRKGLRLGDMLLRSGKIGESDLQDALENAKIQKKMLGEVLVENGYLGEGEIEDVIRVQIEEEIYDLFLWKRANYEFIEGPPPEDLAGPDARVTQLSFDVNGLLLEAVRRADEWGVINQKIPSLDSVFSFVSESDRNEEDKDSNDAARRVYRLIDGQTSCSEIIENTGVGDFEVCKVLTDLVDRGRVRLLTTQELMDVAARRLAEGRRDIALKMYQAAAQQTPDDPKVVAGIARILENEGENRQAGASHLKAGRSYLETGDLDRALDHLQRASTLDPDDPEIKFGLFEAYAADGNLGEGKKLARELVTHCWTIQDYERGRALCDRIGYADPEDLDFRVWRARLLNQLREKDALREDLDYIRKHLPAEPGERSKVEAVLREIEGRPSTAAPSSTGPKPVSRIVRPRKSKRGLVIGVLAAVLLVGVGVVIFVGESRIRAELDRVLATAQDDLEKQAFVDARKPVDAFLAGSGSWSPIQAERARKFLVQLEARQQTADDDRKARKKREHEALLDRIDTLQRTIGVTRERNPTEALGLARQMRKLSVDANDQDRIATAEKLAGELERFIGDAFQLKRQADELEADGKTREAALLIDRLLVNFPNTLAARGALYPLEIVSHPPGVTVANDRSGVQLGQTTEKPLVIRMKPGASIRLRFEKKGYASVRRDVKDKTLGRMGVELTEKKALWRMPLGFTVSGEAVLLDDMLFVGGSSRLYALRISETAGRLLWFESLEGKVQGAPSVAGRHVFVGTDRGWLYCLDPSRSKDRKAWTRGLGGRILSEPGVSPTGDRVYVGTVGRTLHSINAQSGDVVWTRGLPGEARTPPVVAGRTVFVGCSDGTILALNGPGPEGEVWRFRAEPNPGPMVLAGGTLYVPAGPYLYALDALEGRRIWKRLLSPGVKGRVTRQGDRVVAADGQGKIHFLDAATGESLDDFDARGPVQGGVVGAGPLVLFGIEGGRFTALDTGRSTLRWEFTSEGKVQAACTPGGGLVYLCSGGSLFAIELN